MAKTVTLSDEIAERLQALSPLFELPEIIGKLLDKHYPVNGMAAPTALTPIPQPSPGVPAPRLFNPASPPSLTHTKLLSVQFCGRTLDRGDATWNGLMNAAILEACGKLKDPERVKQLIIVNCLVGKKEDEGYRYIPKAGISVQGQDAIAAWKAAHHIATQLGCAFDVVFAWRHKEDAAHPGVTGRFSSGQWTSGPAAFHPQGGQ